MKKISKDPDFKFAPGMLNMFCNLNKEKEKKNKRKKDNLHNIFLSKKCKNK